MEYDFDDQKLRERVVLVGISSGEEGDGETSLEELAQLAETAGAETVGRVLQNRESAHPATYLGKGKLEEVKWKVWETEATGIICDDELSPAQLRNMEEALETKVMDRTMVILDIFASRANTKEGKIQVELAQLRFLAVRLAGMRKSLSRLGGGIGTRGPGETKLETDRRRLHARIGQLKAELGEVKRHRQVARQQRSKNQIPVAAIVGYTNAGKSTLLNQLTDAGSLAEDKLFATLDPITRNLRLKDGQELLVTDTVGFIRKLPHHLVEAFRSTLEEARYSDIILHVADCSNPQMEMQMYVAYETLRQLQIQDKVIVTVFNKADKLQEETALRDFSSDYQVKVSAKTGEGLDELKEILAGILRSRRVYLEKVIPYQEGGKLQVIRKKGQLLSEEYTEEGIAVKAYVPAELFAMFF